MPRPINRDSDLNLLKDIERYDTKDKCRLTLENCAGLMAFAVFVAMPKGSPALTSAGNSSAGACGYHFSVTAGTIFHDSHLPLRKWFIAIYLVCESQKGVSALQLKRTLGVAKTA